MTDTAALPPGDDGQPRHTLVPVGDDGDFLLFGDAPLPGHSVLPVPYLRGEDEARVSTALATATGVGNVGLQAARALPAMQGLVRLSPQTLAALRAGATPLASGGANLGTLVKGGKFVAQVRWLPAGAAGTTAALAAVGPALAVMAVQWQITALSQQVQRSITLTRTVLDELRAESWHELHAAAAAVTADARHALAVGAVPDRAFANLQGQGVEAQLRKHRARHLDDLQRRQADFAGRTGDKARSAWLTDNLSDLLRDVQAVHAAQQGLSLYQALRAANLRRNGDPVEESWAAQVLAAARDEQHECLILLDDTVRTLDRDLSLLLDVDPRRQIPLNGSKQPLASVRDALRGWHGGADLPAQGERPALSDPVVPAVPREVGISAKESPRLRSLVRWLVEPGEAVRLLASGELDREGQRRTVLLALTPRRLLFADRAALDRGEAVVVDLGLAETEVTIRDRVGDREQIGLTSAERSATFLVKSDPAAPVVTVMLATRNALAVENTEVEAIEGEG